MDEKTEEKVNATTDTGEGDKPKVPKATVDANAAAERMEKANEDREKLVEREEELAAQRALEGEAEAGAQPPKKPKETDEEYAERFEKGEVNPLGEDGQ